jgi:hypothetical protein
MGVGWIGWGLGRGFGAGAMGARFGLCAFAGVALRLFKALAATRGTPFVAALGVGLAATGETEGWC